ncbi:CDP-paratose 2-epimerase [Thalassoglobus neptunius]|uniref:CDP-paratose 2-epimerase n=1 Tax=Thalassoglobus neptunius TaxID=1938619 RepID=A0A5C5X329_9PLAN|nr:NAD-dependent epimerase/dehydratase family protein [Thalassoglobus neptunius]TWT57487.1 CDP-paratose 2-epimerase [Thalassoglobus neptunius]
MTGAAGLIGAEACRQFSNAGFQIVGIDNDLRAHFFGPGSSTTPQMQGLKEEISDLVHHPIDIRDRDNVDAVFSEYSSDISVVIHTAGQPSHDWAASDPFTDFNVNAGGTLNLLEATRSRCPEACFLFTSTNKVYGDCPNSLPLVEEETRWELESSHPYFEHGIDESMPIDQTTHSLFGCSKAAADLLVQEYGRYFGMKTAVFRGGCLTGPGHSGAQLHGFLSYLTKCAVQKIPYRIFGYQGKQVRDNIHAYDFVRMLLCCASDPVQGGVFNAGGGRFSHCSILEAIGIIESLRGEQMEFAFEETPRRGDHQWYLSDTRRFSERYPEWSMTRNLQSILEELIQAHEAAIRT